MKTSLICLLVAVLFRLAANTQTVGLMGGFLENSDAMKYEKQPRDIYLASGINGHWCTIARFNKNDKTAKGYEANYTVIFCKYKPVVSKVGQTYQITFTSELSEKNGGIP